MEWNYSSEPNSPPSALETSCHLWNHKVLYLIHKSLPLDLTPSQVTPS